MQYSLDTQSDKLALRRQQSITLDSTLKHAKLCHAVEITENLDASTTKLQNIRDKHADQPVKIHATPYRIYVSSESGCTS